MTTAREHITDTLNRAQLTYERTTDPLVSPAAQREAIALFLYHTSVALLLENLRRLDEALADRLMEWIAAQDGGIFGDSWAGELVHQWREQLAAGQDMEPIAPSTDRSPA